MPPNKQRILAVDDEPKNLKILTLTLGDEWIVETAETGEEAIEKAAKNTPDVVLLDIMMPGIDGYVVCQKLKEDPQYKFTKILLVTSKAMIEEKLRGYEVGADDYVTKPFAPEELLAKVRAFLKTVEVEKEIQNKNTSLEDQVEAKAQQLIDANTRMINAAKLSSIGEVTKGLVGEIDDPISVINTMSNQIKEIAAESKSEVVESMADAIDETSHRIARIVKNVKTFSNPTEEEQRITPHSLKDIWQESFFLLEQRFKNAAIDVEVSDFPEDCQLECSAQDISQLFINLLNNSFDAIYNTKEPWVRLEVEDRDDHLQIRMIDSGSGIAEEIQGNIFQAFFTTKGSGKGTGLGLSVSQKIAEKYQGDLQYDKAHENTCFVLTLPKKQADTFSSAA